MDPDKLQRLRKNHISLKRDLDTCTVLDHLFQENVFSTEDCEHVKNKPTTVEQNHELLNRIRKRGNKGHEVLLNILEFTGSHLHDVLESTQLDEEVIGEDLSENVFFNPSDDFELKRLIDQLTKDGRITQDHLERMKLFVVGEAGCSDSVLRTKDTPRDLFRHLMEVHIVTQYNLTFLQSLLWNVDLKDECQIVATFAVNSDKEPVFFYQPDKIENGFVPCDLHVAGNTSNFKGVQIEDICCLISRYTGLHVPRARVRPVGIKPSTSIILSSSGARGDCPDPDEDAGLLVVSRSRR